MSRHTDRVSPARRKARALLLGAACVTVFMTACGKKGPLYLPDQAVVPGDAGAQSVGSVTQPAKK